jgi:arylsulfatase
MPREEPELKFKLRYFATLSILLVSAVASAQQKRPNIVLILADDLGFSDLSCYGSEIPTPNIDAIAQRGVRFTEFYNQSRCCPTRAALMTGRYPHQVGIGAMIDRYATWIRDAANRPSYQDHLSPQSPTMAELLRKAGYSTIMCGKWHLGDRPEEWPAKRGFDRSFVLIPGAMNYWGGESDGPRSPMALDDKPFTPPHDGFFSTDAFTDHAIQFIDDAAKQKDKPFFLYMAYNAPHWPLHAPPADIEKFRGKYDAGWQAIRDARFKRMTELNIIDPSVTKMSPMDRGQQKPWDQMSADQQKEWSLRMSIYAAQVARMDANIGRVTAELTKLGVADDTLVVFVSDNGGAPEDPHRGKPGAELGTRDSFWGYARPWATVSNTPWRLHKVTSYEGGISTPAIAAWPGGIPASANGTLVHGPAHVLDLMPTFLALAGASYPKTDAMNAEGKDILAMMKGESGKDDRTLCWEHEGNRAIRKGKWKLVMLADMPGWELFDIEADRIESNNLAERHPEIVKELSANYDRWAARCGVVPWSEIEPHRPAPATQPARRRRG